MKKISNGQFFSLIVLSSLSDFLIMTFKNFSSEEAILGAFVAMGIETVFSIPLMVFLSRDLKSGEASKTITAVFLIISSAELVAKFCEFMSKEYSHIGKPWMIAVLLCFVAGYIASFGVEGIARSESLVLILSLGVIAFVTILSLDKTNVLNFDPLTEKSDIISATLSFLSVSRTLALSFSLSENLKYGASKFIFLGILSSFLIQSSMLLLVAFCLGKYVLSEDFLLSAFSEFVRADIIRHFSAVMMAISTIITLLTLGISLSVASKKRKSRLFIATASATALSLFIILKGYRLNPIFMVLFGVAVGVVMPFYDYQRSRKCEKML